MTSKIATFMTRVMFAGLFWLVIAIIQDGPEVATVVFVILFIYSLVMFHDSYDFSMLKIVVGKFVDFAGKKNKVKIEDEMLRVKDLLDKGILTEAEYNNKMKSLKREYFE